MRDRPTAARRAAPLALLIALAACAPATPPPPAPPPVAEVRPTTVARLHWIGPRPNGAGLELGGWQHVIVPREVLAGAIMPDAPLRGAEGDTPAMERQRIALALAALRRHCAGGPAVTTREDRLLIAWLMEPMGMAKAEPDCGLLAAADALRDAAGQPERGR